MTGYLEEAAQLLRKAAETNEQSNGPASRCPSPRMLGEGHERIAMKFAQLGAIEAGVIPAEMVPDLLAALVRKDGTR